MNTKVFLAMGLLLISIFLAPFAMAETAVVEITVKDAEADQYLPDASVSYPGGSTVTNATGRVVVVVEQGTNLQFEATHVNYLRSIQTIDILTPIAQVPFALHATQRSPGFLAIGLLAFSICVCIFLIMKRKP